MSMRSAWNLAKVTACILTSGLLASCGDDDDCGAGAASAPCPYPDYGWARVSGYALADDGTPIANKQVLFACADNVATNYSSTDAEGRFIVSLTYSVPDTLQQPFPPRQPDGSFSVECQAGLEVAGTFQQIEGFYEILFGPTENDIRQTEVEVRLPPESPAS